jgi:hypothetical protein
MAAVVTTVAGVVGRAAFRRAVLELLRRSKRTSVRASRAGARVLQRRLKRWALRHYHTGFMRRNIIIERTRGVPLGATVRQFRISRRQLSRRGLSRRVASHRVTIPRHRFTRFYYPYQFRREWEMEVRKARRSVLIAIKRAR